MRDANHSTVIQGYDFHIGESFVAAMDQALRECRWVMCLLSPDYLRSRWCQEEWQAAHYAKRMVLVRIVHCDPDGLLGPIARLDLVGTDESAARELLLNAIQQCDGADLRPTQCPVFPVSKVIQPRRRFPTQLPSIWKVPEQRNPYFTGRNNTLNAMHDVLSAGNTAALTQAIKGLGGVGKTQLALEYTYRYATEYDGIWWLRAENPITLAQPPSRKHLRRIFHRELRRASLSPLARSTGRDPRLKICTSGASSPPLHFS